MDISAIKDSYTLVTVNQVAVTGATRSPVYIQGHRIPEDSDVAIVKQITFANTGSTGSSCYIVSSNILGGNRPLFSFTNPGTYHPNIVLKLKQPVQQIQLSIEQAGTVSSSTSPQDSGLVPALITGNAWLSTTIDFITLNKKIHPING